MKRWLLGCLFLTACGVAPTAIVDAGTSVCGIAGRLCCAGACGEGLACIQNVCRTKEFTDLGRSCAQPADCQSRLCAGVVDGGLACTISCGGSSDCANGWTCERGACACTAIVCAPTDGGPVLCVSDRCPDP